MLRSLAVVESTSSTFILPAPPLASVRSRPSPLALIDAVTPMPVALILVDHVGRGAISVPSLRSIVALTPAALVILNLPGATPLPPL